MGNYCFNKYSLAEKGIKAVGEGSVFIELSTVEVSGVESIRKTLPMLYIHQQCLSVSRTDSAEWSRQLGPGG